MKNRLHVRFEMRENTAVAAVAATCVPASRVRRVAQSQRQVAAASANIAGGAALVAIWAAALKLGGACGDEASST